MSTHSLSVTNSNKASVMSAPSYSPGSIASDSSFKRKKTIASRFSKAESEYKKKADKKKQKNENTARQLHEKESAIARYRDVKIAKYKLMAKKTAKGQPIMKYRVKYLLQQAERQYKYSSLTDGSGASNS